MLTNADIDRFDSIMDRITQRREERGFPPDRDEDKIAEILYKAERAAAEEHARLVESTQQFASAVRFQVPANEIDDGRGFPQIDRYRNFES